jgi:hypothetical protein
VSARRAEHDCARIRVGVKTLEGVGQLGDQRGVEMVTRTAFEFDCGDVIGGRLDVDLMTHEGIMSGALDLNNG